MTPAHRAGVAALLGPPNAGKSTLLNRLLGQKLAIVTARPQTTRSRLLGIWSLPHAQVLLQDTPGLHPGVKPLNRALNALAGEALEDCDVGLLLAEFGRGWSEAHERLWKGLRARGAPVVLVGTKSDAGPRREPPWPQALAGEAAAALRVSAQSGEGLAELEAAVVALLPEAPPFYPPDEISDRPLRFLAAEWVREAAFEELDQELPYELAVEVVEFDESRPGRVRIRAELLVARASQKRIAVGAGGAMVKRIGSRARRELERLLEARVHLELWVKVEPQWARQPKRLKTLGYR